MRGHGGEEVYSALLRDRPPEGVTVDATFDVHASSRHARCAVAAEIGLNRLVRPHFLFNMGFRVLEVGPGVDLVHVHTHPTVLKRLRGRPVVFSAGSSHYHYVRDYEGWAEPRIRRTYARARPVYRALGALDALLNHRHVTVAYTFSEWARRAYLAFGVPPAKIRVLPPGFDIAGSAPALRSSEPVFLFMGRQPARKGGDLALAAFTEVRRLCPAARMIYVSDERPGRPMDGVEFRDMVAPEHVADLYGSASVFVNPTRAEGYGFTNVEAQGFGLAVVSTAIAAIPEVVEHQVTGFLVAPGDVGALAAAMQRLAQSAALRADMGAAARERFEARFTLGRFQRGLRALYDEATARAGTA